MGFRIRLLCVVMLASWCGLSAQGGLKIDEAAARANVVKQVDPVYPPIARAAHVAGDVVVQVKIAANGRVESVKALSGPDMLRTAAVDAVRQWQFKPAVIDGFAASVTAELVIPFSMGEVVDTTDLAIARDYFALAATCHKLVAARTDTAAQAVACRKAAVKASEFSSDKRFIERRSAYVFCATALMRNKNFKEAVTYGTRAVDVVKLGHDDGSGSSAAYAVRGQAEALAGDLPAADQDLADAERFQRAAMESAAGHDPSPAYTASLKQLLIFRTQVLDALGKTAEADRMAAEAKKY
jgi:TonB family protein